MFCFNEKFAQAFKNDLWTVRVFNVDGSVNFFVKQKISKSILTSPQVIFLVCEIWSIKAFCLYNERTQNEEKVSGMLSTVTVVDNKQIETYPENDYWMVALTFDWPLTYQRQSMNACWPSLNWNFQPCARNSVGWSFTTGHTVWSCIRWSKKLQKKVFYIKDI